MNKVSKGRQRKERRKRHKKAIIKYSDFLYMDKKETHPCYMYKIGSVGICTNCADTILISGGFVDGYSIDRKEYDEVFEYNIKTKKYSKHSTMIEPNYGHKMFKIESDIFIIGGKLKSGEIHIFKSNINKWINKEINYDFGSSNNCLYLAKENFIHIFDTTNYRHWSINVVNNFIVNQLPDIPNIELIIDIIGYNNEWYIFGRKRRYDFNNSIWYYDINTKKWKQKTAKFDPEWYRFKCLLYYHYVIIGNITCSQGYGRYTSGVYDIENDIFVKGYNNNIMVGLPLSGLILKHNYNRIYSFGGDDTDRCGKFLTNHQSVIILKDIQKEKIKFIIFFILKNCALQNNIIIPNIVAHLIANYTTLCFIC